ncbi:MAG: hypothetical protein KDD34_04315, partial [Bdellovibrionales bacterium]|nr:hypothetical protein [Bdellovibrionales bacterium]
AKNNYRNERKALVDEFLSRIDSIKVREAIHTDNLDKLNDLLHNATRFKNLNDGVEDITYPKDMSKYDGINKDADAKKGEVKKHFFAQEGNPPIDIGLLMAINKDFQMTTAEMAELKLNDFTLNPAAAFFDIEKLVEPFEISGLRKRTFIGPVTFLLNSNGSHIRPTDTLDEVFCINNSCSAGEVTEKQLREWTYEGDPSFYYKRFYNSVAHFFNKHVDDLILCKDGGLVTHKELLKIQTFCGVKPPERKVFVNQDLNGKRYEINHCQTDNDCYEYLGLDDVEEREIKARSLMSNYVNLNNLDYVSLEDHPLQTVRKDCEYPFYDKTCLISHSQNIYQSQDLIDQINQTHRDPFKKTWVSQEEKEEDPYLIRLRSGTSPEDRLKARLPIDLDEHQVTKGDLAKLITDYNPSQDMEISSQLNMKLCIFMAESYIQRLLSYGVLNDWLQSDLKDRLISDCVNQKFKGSRQGLIKMDKKLRVEETKRFLFKGGKSMNVNVGSSTGIDQKFSVDGKFSFDFMALPRHLPIIGSIFNGAGAQIGKSASRGKSSGLSLNSGTYLVMQAATFDIELQAFEPCLILSYDTKYLDAFNVLAPYTVRWKEHPEKMANALDYGLMICSGKVEIPRDPKDPSQLKPYPVRERYYYLTQHFTEGDMLDAGDLYNHPWLLMLRGRRDFNIFMATINGFTDKSLSLFDITTPVAHVDKYTWPIENLVDTYLDVRPTTPGLYTVLPNEPHDFPWGDDAPDDSFVAPLSLGLGLGKYQDLVENVKSKGNEYKVEQLNSNDNSLEGLVEPQAQ